MKILILTQKVDVNDDVLGFFHGWLEKFAPGFEKITAICLGKGKCELPDNVKVLSLGKEDLRFKIYDLRILNRLKYIVKFYYFIIKERKNYDAVFVHMNPVYLVLGGLFWQMSGRNVYLWYNHKKGNLTARAGALFARNIFYTSPFSFFAGRKNAKIMPAGIDTEVFRQQDGMDREKNSILYLGRISPIKKIECLIEAVQIIVNQREDFKARIIGSPANAEDSQYLIELKKQAGSLIDKGVVEFLPPVSNRKAAEIFNAHEIFVNMTPTGSFDKAIFEAMACERVVVVSNRALAGILPEEFIFEENNSHNLAEKLLGAMAMPEDKKKNWGIKFRQYAAENHSLDKLADKIKEVFHEN